jgi:hypothetical protein
MALSERDIFGSPFGLNDEVLVRGKVTAVTSASGNPGPGYGGSGDSVTILVDTPGNAGEIAGVTFVVSPIQCRRAQGPTDGPTSGPSYH